MDNAAIADRLDAFAAVLELGDANPYTIRAYRRAAQTVRDNGVPVAELVAAGRSRELRGIGPGIEARLRELVETGQIAELAELERDLVPDLVGLGRYLGLSAQRVIDIARALDIRTAGELREAAAAGRLRDVPGIGPKTEAQIVSALARESEARSPRGVWLNRARELVGSIASAIGAEPAGDVRRWVTHATTSRSSVRRRVPRRSWGSSRSSPDRRGNRAGRATRRRGHRGRDPGGADGARARQVRDRDDPCDRVGRYVAALEPLPVRPDEEAVYAPSACVVPPRAPRGRVPRRAPGPRRDRADPRGPALSYNLVRWASERRGDGVRRSRTGLEYLAICDHTPAVGAVKGLTPDEVRRQGEEIAAANAELAPFRVLRGIECDILPDGRLDLPDDVLAELDWVQASVHGGQRMPRAEMTKRVEEGLRHPAVRCLSHPTGRLINRRPENALDLDRIYELAQERERRPGGQRPARPARPQRRARARRAARRRPDRLLHRRALPGGP